MDDVELNNFNRQLAEENFDYDDLYVADPVP